MDIPSQNTKYTTIYTGITKPSVIPSQKKRECLHGLKNLRPLRHRIKIYENIYTDYKTYGHSVTDYKIYKNIYRDYKTYGYSVTEYKIYENIYTDHKTYRYSVTEYKIYENIYTDYKT